MRQATVLVADDWSHTLTGKFNLVGAYNTDISIPLDPTLAAQLVFLFIVETSTDDPFQKLEVHVALPGGDSRHLVLPLHQFVLRPSDQRRWCVRYPLLFLNPLLRPGPIEATVIHEKGTISTAAPFIIMP
jgi:hypothetical protein